MCIVSFIVWPDMSVLLDDTQLVEFIRNYIREPNGVFFISSMVRILMTSFPAFSLLFVQTVCKKQRAIDLYIDICRFLYNKKSYAMA